MSLTISNAQFVSNVKSPEIPPSAKKAIDIAGTFMGVSNASDKYVRELPSAIISKAKANGYGEYYNLSVSPDGKYLQVKIKETPWYIKDPTLSVIKSDFINDESGVLVGKGYIPHGNEDLINKRSDSAFSEHGRDYDNLKLRPGDTINIPIEKVVIQDSPCGFWGRL